MALDNIKDKFAEYQDYVIGVSDTISDLVRQAKNLITDGIPKLKGMM